MCLHTLGLQCQRSSATGSSVSVLSNWTRSSGGGGSREGRWVFKFTRTTLGNWQNIDCRPSVPSSCSSVAILPGPLRRARSSLRTPPFRTSFFWPCISPITLNRSHFMLRGPSCVHLGLSSKTRCLCWSFSLLSPCCTTYSARTLPWFPILESYILCPARCPWQTHIRMALVCFRFGKNGPWQENNLWTDIRKIFLCFHALIAHAFLALPFIASTDVKSLLASLGVSCHLCSRCLLSWGMSIPSWWQSLIILVAFSFWAISLGLTRYCKFWWLIVFFFKRMLQTSAHLLTFPLNQSALGRTLVQWYSCLS